MLWRLWCRAVCSSSSSSSSSARLLQAAAGITILSYGMCLRTSGRHHYKCHITHHTSHVTYHTSHISRHTSHITHHTSHMATAHAPRSIATLSGHSNWVKCLVYFPPQNLLFSAADDKSVRVWDARTGDCLADVRNVHGEGTAGALM